MPQNQIENSLAPIEAVPTPPPPPIAPLPPEPIQNASGELKSTVGQENFFTKGHNMGVEPIIPITFFASVALIMVAGIFMRFKVRKMQQDSICKAIEKIQNIDANIIQSIVNEGINADNEIRLGVNKIALGLGFGAAFGVLWWLAIDKGFAIVCLVASILALFAGFGNLVSAKLRTKN